MCMQWNQYELESVCCDLCNSAENRSVIVRPDGLRVVECLHCGLCYLNPRPNVECISRLYSSEYFQKPVEGLRIGYTDYLEDDARASHRLEAQNRFATIKKYGVLQRDQCLEVGCATGEFSSLLHREGLDVTAIDISQEVIEHAKARFSGPRFMCGDLGRAVADSTFDLICAFEVIEHVVSPRKFVTDAARSLKPGGFLVLTTPNYDCAKRVGPESWLGFQTSFEHLYFFSPGAFDAYSSITGIEVVDWLTDRSDGVSRTSSVGGGESCRLHPGKRVLNSFGLLQPARRFKNYIACQRGTNYLRHGQGHNLLIILQKKSGE